MANQTRMVGKMVKGLEMVPAIWRATGMTTIQTTLLAKVMALVAKVMVRATAMVATVMAAMALVAMALVATARVAMALVATARVAMALVAAVVARPLPLH